jgi:hypothetical protein
MRRLFTLSQVTPVHVSKNLCPQIGSVNCRTICLNDAGTSHLRRPLRTITQKTFMNLEVISTYLPGPNLAINLPAERILLLVLFQIEVYRRRLHQGHTLYFRSLNAPTLKTPRQGVRHNAVHPTSVLHSKRNGARYNIHLPMRPTSLTRFNNQHNANLSQ